MSIYRLPQKLVLENEKRLEAFFKAHDITSAVVEFDGSGDSGSIESVTFYRGKKILDDVRGTVTIWQQGAAEFDKEANKWTHGEPVEKPCDIRRALEEHVYDALDRTGVDWYNNDGGFGHWSWSADEGLEFEVNTRYVESVLDYGVNRPMGVADDREGAPE